jgi:hypothetical protein
MKPEKLLIQLTSLAEHLGLKIREEKGDFGGGLCKIDGEDIIFLNQQHGIIQKNHVLSQAIAQLPLDGVFMIPALREHLDKYQNREVAKFEPIQTKSNSS